MTRRGRRIDSRGGEPSGLRELRQEVGELRHANSAPHLRQPSSGGGPRAARRHHVVGSAHRERAARRRRLLVLGGVALIALVLTRSAVVGSSPSFTLPSRAALTGLGVRRRIVAIASSQVGYATNPSNSYCNKFSAYWNAGSPSCPSGEASEEWCADFAAWAWHKAGVELTYGYGPGDLNARAVSFYEWGVVHGTWHSAFSGYRAAAGDVAVYGLRLGGYPSAAHVAIVTGDGPGRRGPDVINGDGDRTRFSVVEVGTDEFRADTGHRGGALLAGYASP